MTQEPGAGTHTDGADAPVSVAARRVLNRSGASDSLAGALQSADEQCRQGGAERPKHDLQHDLGHREPLDR